MFNSFDYAVLDCENCLIQKLHSYFTIDLLCYNVKAAVIPPGGDLNGRTTERAGSKDLSKLLRTEASRSNFVYLTLCAFCGNRTSLVLTGHRNCVGVSLRRMDLRPSTAHAFF